MHAFNFTAKKVALACNSCTGWVGRAGNLIAVAAVTVRIQSTDFGISDFLLEEHLTLYYTVFKLYEDRHRVAQKVFGETTYCL